MTDRIDDKELREKIRDKIYDMTGGFEPELGLSGEIADQILALLQPKIEEAVVQARKEQMVIDWEQAGKDVEEARRQERERILKLYDDMMERKAFVDLHIVVDNFRRALKGRE